MGLLDFIEKTQKNMMDKSENFVKKIGVVQQQLEKDPTEALTHITENFTKKRTYNKDQTSKRKTAKSKTVKSKTVKNIIKTFYADYSEIPYISDDRPEDWIERATMFPNSIIPKSMMKRYRDGLLPGHVYMLYWLKKYTNKKVPVYFEYKYGIDFEKEKVYLYNNGFLNDLNKPTEKGEKAISNHYKVIENHAPPKPDNSIEGKTAQILKQRDSFLKNGFKEYMFIANSNCCEVCQSLNHKTFKISQFKIGVNAPPMHEGCRCSIAAHEDEEEFQRWLNSL